MRDPSRGRELPAGFRLLLRALPEEFRSRHRTEILDLAHSYASGSALRRGLVWIRAGIDVVWVGTTLRIRGALARRGGEGTMMDGIRQDLGFAARALRRRPGFTLVAVVTLALGIGANTAIFSVVNGVLLRPLPYLAADRIGILWHEFGDGAQNLPAVHALDVVDYRDRSRVFETFTMATGREWILGESDDPELVDAGIVESGFFEFFGASPMLGRSFTPEEDVPGAAPVVVLSHRLWARRFGADPGLVGSTIELAGTRMEVVGVLPESFRLLLPAEAFLLRDAEVWTTLRLDPDRQPPRNFTGFTAFGRLRPGASFEQAQEELEVLEAQLKAEHPVHAASKLQARVVPLHADVVKAAETTLVVLLGAVGFVLLIACANVANLLIVRGHGRAQEYAVRAALGAGRRGLVRLAFAEAALLAGAGAALGALLAVGSVELLVALAPGSVPRLDAVRVDGSVLGFVAALTAASACLFGLLPAWRSASGDPAAALVADLRTTSGRDSRRLRNALVVGEIAASLVLLVGTGLMVRSFAALTAVDPGYATDGVLTFRVNVPGGAFTDGDARDAFMDELLTELRALPGVDGATAMNQLPLTGAGALQPFAYDEETATNWESVTADQRYVTPGFFGVAGARLLAGRDFTREDAALGNRIVVDERLAEIAFPGRDPVGELLQVNPNDSPEHIRYAQIVGVVSHLRLHDVSRPHLTQIFYPMAGSFRFSVLLRTSGDAETLVAPVRSTLARLAPGAPVEDVRTMRALFDGSLAPDRLALALMSAFGLVALLLASVGIYGVLSYVVAQRTREIGVRMALGQAPSAVTRVVLAEGGRLVVVALALGVAGAALLSHLASSLLYGVQPLDVPTYVVTCLALVSAAAVACWIPARRATRVDPVQALRE